MRATGDRIPSWDFALILLPHAVAVQTGGKAVFRDATAWLG